MRFFISLIHPASNVSPDECRARYEGAARAHGLGRQWCTHGPVSTLIAEDTPGKPLVAYWGNDLAVGLVRLDNRADVARWVGSSGEALTDLELVLRVVTECGSKLIPELLGDFAFLVWEAATRRVTAACDAFGVRKLYYVVKGDLLGLSSRAEALDLGIGYDQQYLAEIAGYCKPSWGRTVYAGVNCIPEATVAVFEGGGLTQRRYWSCYDFQPSADEHYAEAPAVDTCRRLLAESVSARVTGGEDTWAQLSGGMDSSSVVSVAQMLVQTGAVNRGLGGTVTYFDCHGTGADERRYAQAVTDRWGLQNESIGDWSIWQEDHLGPPRTDQPNGLYPFYARDRKLCEVVRSAGGRVLLTGQGGDELFLGNMFFFADWLAAGRVWSSLKEMARRAAAGRVSFWELAYKNALLPLLPRPLQRCLVRGEGRMPPWLAPGAVQQYGLRERASAPLSYGGRFGHKYADAVATTIAGIAAKLTGGLIEDSLEVRHPYLYRPLVEFALRLSPGLTVRPHARKWVLREAMRGILPDEIRTRVGKGVLLGLLSWSTARHRAYLEPLLRNPILGQLGIIEPKAFQAAFTAAPHEHEGTTKGFADVQYTLALEAWLQVRSGQWPPRFASTSSKQILPSVA